MENSEIKERICNLLESVVEKTESINKSEEPDSLIEVDLVLDDLKRLYKEYFRLKKLAEKQLKEGERVRDSGRLGSIDPSRRTFPRTFVTPPPEDEESTESDNNDKVNYKKAEQASDETKNQMDSSGAGKESQSSAHSAKNDTESQANSSVDSSSIGTKTQEVQQEGSGKQRDDISKQKEKYEEDDKGSQQQYKNVKQETQDPGENNNSKKKNRNLADVVGQNQDKALGDKYVAEEDTSLNKRLAKMKEEVDIGTSMQHKPIKNLKTSIGVNEKFLFINELFEGDIEAYNEAIEKLNSFNNLDEAFEYINQLNKTYSWDGYHSAETIDKFAYLVQRRYMTN